MDEADAQTPEAARRAKSSAARAVSRVVFACLLLLVVVAPAPYGSVDPWWESAFECAVFALTALSLLGWLFDGGPLLPPTRWRLVAPLFALALYALAQTAPVGTQPTPAGNVIRAISFDPYETRLVAAKLIALALTLALFLRHTNSQRRLRALFLAVVTVAVASAAFGLTRQVAQRGAQGFVLARLQPGSGYAQFINKNHFAFLAEMALGLLAGLVAARGVARERVLIYVALAVPLWTALVLSNSRGGILAMLCQLLFVALTYGFARSAKRGDGAQSSPTRGRAATTALRLVLACALLFVIVFGVVWVGGDPLAERMGSVRDEASGMASDPTRTGRAAIWQATWRLALAHPLFGVGFGGYWMAITETHDGSGALVPQQAHNDYLELLASGGILGVALSLWFASESLRLARRALLDPAPFRRAVAFGALAGLFGVAVHSLVDFGLHVTGNAIVAVALLALACASVAPDEALSARHQKTISRPY